MLGGRKAPYMCKFGCLAHMYIMREIVADILLAYAFAVSLEASALRHSKFIGARLRCRLKEC